MDGTELRSVRALLIAFVGGLVGIAGQALGLPADMIVATSTVVAAGSLILMVGRPAIRNSIRAARLREATQRVEEETKLEEAEFDGWVNVELDGPPAPPLVSRDAAAMSLGYLKGLLGDRAAW